MKRCVIDPVLALEDKKLGGGKLEYWKVFRDAKLAISRAFKVIKLFLWSFSFHISFSALAICLQSLHMWCTQLFMTTFLFIC